MAAAARINIKIIRKKKPDGRPIKPILFPPYSTFLTFNFRFTTPITCSDSEVTRTCFGMG